MGGRQGRPDVDWAVVRRAYETTDETIKSLCERFGVTKSAFETKFRNQKWLSRQAAKTDLARSTRERLFIVLDRQLVKLASVEGDTLSEKEAQQLTELVKNFEKLTNTQAVGEDNGGPSQKKDMRDLRAKLAKRIDQYNRR